MAPRPVGRLSVVTELRVVIPDEIAERLAEELLAEAFDR